jgi:hypothetical protein
MTSDGRVQKAVAMKLLRARTQPPSVMRLCWPVVPLLVVVGAASVVALVALGMPESVIFVTAGMYVGAALSSFGVARKVSRLWPIQRELLDWPKIEAAARGA